MLAGIMEVIKLIHTILQENVKADLSANGEKIQSLQEIVKTDLSGVKKDLSGVKADLTANNEKIQSFQDTVKADLSSVKDDISSKFSQLQEANVKFQEKLRSETKAENEKLAKRFELQSQQSNKEFSAKLDSEARRLTNLVGQVQKETESEIVAMKKQLQEVNTGFETRLDQSSTRTQDIIDELANQMVDHRSEVQATISKLDQNVNHRLTRQRESTDKTKQAVNATESKLEQVNAKFAALDSKITDAPSRAAVAAESCSSKIIFSPFVVNPNGASSSNAGTTSSNNSTNENHACSCQSGNTCNVCVRASGSTTGMNGEIASLSVSSFLSSSELLLSLFDDSSDTNPAFHLRRLDEFIRLKGVPKTF
jgi:hypothetical protein